MQFQVFFPPQTEKHKVPVLFWLGDEHHTPEDFMQKSGILKLAAEYGIGIVAVDSSPKGNNIPITEDGIGEGLSYYVDATQTPWSYYFNMYSYISQELPALIRNQFPQFLKSYGISGFGMGGHGALTIGLRHPDIFSSLSAFAPMCNPKQCSKGIHALSYYLGTDRDNWDAYDSVTLVNQAQCKTPILLDQGLQDEALSKQLNTKNLEVACTTNQHPLEVNFRAGYDHSYYFVSTFLENHIQHHYQALSHLSMANSA
jgi:S-formylglutathione hydrolase